MMLTENILVNTLTSYCSWIYNRCPTKNTKLFPNILLIVCCSLLVFIRYGIPFVYNYQAAFTFSFYPFSNLAILRDTQEIYMRKRKHLINQNSKMPLLEEISRRILYDQSLKKGLGRKKKKTLSFHYYSFFYELLDNKL